MRNYTQYYCMLCRAEEIKKYGTLAETRKQHIEACKKAGCKHPPEWNVR